MATLDTDIVIWLEPEDDREPALCPECGGTGSHPWKSAWCPACDGTGHVLNTFEV